MTLRARYATQAEIPEAIRGFYTEANGAFVLQLADAEDVYASGLKRNHQQVLDDFKKLQATVGGLDIEKAKAALAAAASLEEEKAKVAGKWDEYKAGLQSEFAKEKKTLADENAALSSSLYDSLVTSVLATELTRPTIDGIPRALTPHLRSHLTIAKREDGTYAAQVIDPATKHPRISGSEGKPMTIAQLVMEFKSNPEYAFGFKGSGASGGGAPGGGSRTTTNGDGRSTMSSADKIAAGLAARAR